MCHLTITHCPPLHPQDFRLPSPQTSDMGPPASLPLDIRHGIPNPSPAITGDLFTWEPSTTLQNYWHLMATEAHAVGKRAVRILLECFFVTACKWSLGQSNVFTVVCHSFCPHGRGWLPSMHHRTHDWGGGLYPGGLPPGGRGYAAKAGRVCVLKEGACNQRGRGSASGVLGRPLPPSTTEYGQQADGMHPTGMHSCWMFCLRFQRSQVI